MDEKVRQPTVQQRLIDSSHRKRQSDGYWVNYASFKEIASVNEIADRNIVAADLKEMNWAFTEDETSFFTHDIHPYPAKFIPQIPGQLVARLSLRGEAVLDPFGGSGTTALEAIRLGRRAISIDANPVGSLIGKVKTTRLDEKKLEEIHQLKARLLAESKSIDVNRVQSEFWDYIPHIPHRDKWFSNITCAELALIRACIAELKSTEASDIANLALSRIVTKVSFQDSETRYASTFRDVKAGETTKQFIQDLNFILERVAQTDSILQYGIAKFITADIRDLDEHTIPSESIDLIVTSPPYGNANDYHLYHRFRLFWLGFDPRSLAKIEIGSHLRHQRDATGFDAYISDMMLSLKTMARLLKPGRYAALVIGDAVYKGIKFESAKVIAEKCKQIGFDTVCIINRPIHKTKRSFVLPARRAHSEKILVLQKQPKSLSVTLRPPLYKLHNFEQVLQRYEIRTLLHRDAPKIGRSFTLTIDPYTSTNSRKLAFIRSACYDAQFEELTWQAMLENGLETPKSAKKNSKYVTHGLHAYKGKFYPQLAKSLINISNLTAGSIILDPFCGSGTTLLEGYLNGLSAYGCDLHPLAVKITRAKIGILEIDPDFTSEAISTMLSVLRNAPSQVPEVTDQFDEGVIQEVRNWFAVSTIFKMNWLLEHIRAFEDPVIEDFLEVILSSIIRIISHQDPSDLRIRRRKELLDNVDVFALYNDRLTHHYAQLKRFWSIRGHSPYKFASSKVCLGDSRQLETFRNLGLSDESVDLIITSPPYATALPYIDTDRLSLLTLFGMSSSKRRPLEHRLIGSREITTRDRRELEDMLSNTPRVAELPDAVVKYILSLHKKIKTSNSGFRRKNLPSLLLRFFSDMRISLSNCHRMLKRDGEMDIIIGDNRTRINDEIERIPTTDFIAEISKDSGFELTERIPISVTTENLIHKNHAISQNQVLRFKRR